MNALVIAALAMPLASGLAWRRVLGAPRIDRGTWPFALADAWLLGVGWIGASLVAATVVGAPLDLAIAWPLAALPIAVAPFRRRTGPPTDRPTNRPGAPGAATSSAGERIVVAGLLTLLAITAAQVFAHGLATPLFSTDAFAIWGLKAVTLFESNGLDPVFFTVDRDAPMHPDYPLVQPMFGAWLLANAGVADERLLKAPGAFVWLCLVATLCRAARGRYRTAAALALAAAIGLVDVLLQAATLVNADLLLTALVVRGAIDRGGGDGRIDTVAIACLALAPSVKNEGWAALAAVGIARAFTTPGGAWPRLRVPVWSAVAALAVAAPWIAFRMRHGLYNDLWHGAWVFGPDPSGDPTGAARLAAIARTTADLPSLALFDRAWLVVALGALPVAVAARNRDVRRYALAALALAAAYATALFATPHELVWHVSTAAPRLLGHVLPIALLATVAAAAHFLAPAAPRIIRRWILRDEEK